MCGYIYIYIASFCVANMFVSQCVLQFYTIMELQAFPTFSSSPLFRSTCSFCCVDSDNREVVASAVQCYVILVQSNDTFFPAFLKSKNHFGAPIVLCFMCFAAFVK